MTRRKHYIQTYCIAWKHLFHFSYFLRGSHIEVSSELDPHKHGNLIKFQKWTIAIFQRKKTTTWHWISHFFSDISNFSRLLWNFNLCDETPTRCPTIESNWSTQNMPWSTKSQPTWAMKMSNADLGTWMKMIT